MWNQDKESEISVKEREKKSARERRQGGEQARARVWTREIKGDQVRERGRERGQEREKKIEIE